MPLSEPETSRVPLHRRQITMDGYQRTDGLFDIEAHLVDTKSYPFDNMDRGTIPAGEPLHGMWVRMTVDEKMVIQSCEAVSDYTPYAVCPSAAPNFSSLAGVAIGPGFNKAVRDRVGGILGCTHLREVMAQMATVAHQTIAPVRWRRARQAREALVAAGGAEPTEPVRRLPIGSCLAYAPDSPVVLRHRQNGAE